jgi:hypothetical protein
MAFRLLPCWDDSVVGGRLLAVTRATGGREVDA